MKKYGALLLSILGFGITLCLSGCAAADVPGVFDSIAQMVGGWAPFGAIIAGIAEFALRLIPSVNPKSLFLVISETLHSLGNLIGALSKFIDSLGLQNIKQP